MKQTIVTMLVATIATMTLSTVAFAQRPKMTTQSAPAQSYTPSYAPSYSLRADNDLTALVGLTGGAINIGVDYARMMNSTYGAGGYFFFQTSKDKNNSPIVTQIMSFGGLMKINLLEANGVKVYVAPGAGITLVKDGSVNSAGAKSDETVIGPVWKMGVQFKLAQNFSLGLESTTFGNFFNDNISMSTSAFQYYSVAMGFAF